MEYDTTKVLQNWRIHNFRRDEIFSSQLVESLIYEKKKKNK